MMERNDVSFSIPTWRKEQIKAINQSEEEALYMTSPYNLNDFKTDQPTVQHIFTPNEELSQLQSFTTKRLLNSKIKKEIAIFVVFLYEMIITDSQTTTNGANIGSKQTLPSEKQTNLEQKNKTQLLGMFKQRIFQMDLCKVRQIPKQYSNYYKNQILKKILLQYIGKCVYNISLIELLLVNNQMLRFVVELFVKTVMFEGTLLLKFNQELSFDQEAKMYHDYLSFLIVQPNSVKNVKNIGNSKFRKLFSYEKNQLRSEHFLLRQVGSVIYIYKKYVKSMKLLPIKEEIKSPLKEGRQITKQKKDGQKQKNTQKPIDMTFKKPKPQTVKRLNPKSQPKQGFFGCFSCFRSK